MALLKCPDCQREVSDAADACPACGRAIAKRTSITKPAGCALQFLAVPLMFGSCVMISTGLSPGGSTGTAVLGFVLMVAGAAMFALGRRPAQR